MNEIDYPSDNHKFHEDEGHTGNHISDFTFEEYEELNHELQIRLLKEASPKDMNPASVCIIPW